MRRTAFAVIAIVSAAVVAMATESAAAGDPPLETAGVATLPPFGNHWVWVPDRLMQHSLLYDGDSGQVLGALDSPSLLTPKTPLLSRARGEIYSADIAYSRGLRGERVDFVTIYDAETLDYRAEIVLPTRAGSSNVALAYAESIGERFVGVFNQFPNASVSIVDVERRVFVGEVVITGCSGIYPVDDNRFATLCGNGTVHVVELDAAGSVAGRVSSPRFFDVVEDPVFMAAGRAGTQWVFVSFEGRVHVVDFAAKVPVVAEAWSVAPEASGWRPGGLQHVAVHSGLGRLYVIMHEGGPSTHKDDGPEVWVFDLAERERVARFELPNLTSAFLAPQMQVSRESFSHTLLDWVLPSAGVHSIAVSQDEAPLLFARHAQLGAVAVLDARSGENLRVLTEAGFAGPTLRVP